MQNQRPDTDLWSAFKEGDMGAFGDLFRRYYSLLFQYGTKFCTHHEIVEDCIQELFTELWQNKAAPQVQSVKAYLLTAVKYKIFKSYRGNTTITITEETKDNMNFQISHENFIIEKEDDRQRTDKVLTALNQLPARQREIIYLRVYQDLAYDEISEVMGINYQVTRNLFYQSIKSMRKLLT